MADTFKILGGLFGGPAGVQKGNELDVQREQQKKAAEAQRQQAEDAQLGNSLAGNTSSNNQITIPKTLFESLLRAAEQNQQQESGNLDYSA